MVKYGALILGPILRYHFTARGRSRALRVHHNKTSPSRSSAASGAAALNLHWANEDPTDRRGPRVIGGRRQVTQSEQHSAARG